jgi:hypothetical protein
MFMSITVAFDFWGKKEALALLGDLIKGLHVLINKQDNWTWRTFLMETVF